MKHILRFVLFFVVSFPAWSVCNENIPGAFVNRFIDNNNGTVTDRMTGLIWMRCDLGSSWNNTSRSCVDVDSEEDMHLTWLQALNGVTAVNSNAALYSEALVANDWRLPNIKEIASLVDFHCSPFKLDKNIFPNSDTVYWSSTPYHSKVSFKLDGVNNLYYDAAYVASFINEEDVSAKAIVSQNRVRLVRGPQ